MALYNSIVNKMGKDLADIVVSWLMPSYDDMETIKRRVLINLLHKDHHCSGCGALRCRWHPGSLDQRDFERHKECVGLTNIEHSIICVNCYSKHYWTTNNIFVW